MTKILLVDDDIDMVDFLTNILCDQYQIAKAYHGTEAIKILGEDNIHLVISDVMMPELSGFDLCKVIKSEEEFAHIPVILLTARNTIESKIEGLEFGADAYIEKPFPKEYLLAQAASLIYNRNKIYESFRKNPIAQFSLDKLALDEDKNFITEVNLHITENLGNPDLDVRFLSRKMAMSRSVFYRRVKELSSLSPSEMIIMSRLRKAAELLMNEHYQIKDVSLLTGFNSQANFSRIFFRQFNMTPSEYRRAKQTGADQRPAIE